MFCISILCFGHIANKFNVILSILKEVIIFPEKGDFVSYWQNKYEYPAPCHEPQAPFTVTSPRLQRRLISLHPIAIHENDADIYEALTPSLWKKSVSALIRCIIQVFQFLKPTLTCQR